jgi:ribosomal protein L3 glutamine methyltransferase
MTLPCPPELRTLRDFLRYAVSRFRAAKLEHGHGVTSAHDEAAFLMLEALHLPVDVLDPYLDARLTAPECERLHGLIEARITTRKPACYLVNAAYLGPFRFFVDERVIVPRSYLAEIMLKQGLNDVLYDGTLAQRLENTSNFRVLDLCTGSGCLAIVAAHCFPEASIDAVDLSPEALEVARINVNEYKLEDRIELIHSNLFKSLHRRKYDLIITNPPYVSAAEVAGFPQEYAAEPEMAHLGGDDGMDLVRRILKDAKKHLTPGGGLLCEIGLGREIIEAEYPEIPFLWLDTEESEGEVFFVQREEL